MADELKAYVFLSHVNEKNTAFSIKVIEPLGNLLESPSDNDFRIVIPSKWLIN